MEKNDVDEKLIRWNDIFGELILDTNDLVKDLLTNINYIAIFGGAMMFIGAFLAVMGDIQIDSFLIFGTWMLFGALQLWRWYRLRSKYNRLRTLQSEMKTI
jgi:membrane protein implicated in regulation of membrane protease activity